MLALVRSSSTQTPGSAPGFGPGLSGEQIVERVAGEAACHDLEAGEILFSEGEAKACLYRVISGAICLYREREDGLHEPIGFAHAGDVVGLGALERYMWSAAANVDTRVSRLPLDAAEAVATLEPEVRGELDAASERELELLREQLARKGRGRLAVRLAALLSVIASVNVSEGRDAEVVADDFTCGHVAGMLEVRIEDLEAALVELRKLGLIRAEAKGGLRILDRDGLERLAAA